MATPRAVNPTGAKLLDESKAHPGSLDKSIFEKKSSGSNGATGQGTVNDNYLKECREDNPEPSSQSSETKNQVQLSNCRILTPVEELRLNQEFEMAVDLKKLDPAAASTANFALFATRTRDGKEERAKIWADKPGKAQDDKADPIVVKAKDILATQDDYQLGEKVVFELEASHEGAEAPCKSGLVEVPLCLQVEWAGGDDLFFRTDGEFPLLKDDASLIQVLSAAIRRIEKPPQGETETTICFGFASSLGDAGANRQLSLRRAKAVKAILDRDPNLWGKIAKANFETKDIQQFLSDLNKACGWECDPGEVDGQNGPKTKAAIASFQRECKTRYRLSDLKDDGVCGPKTWAAVLRAIHGQIQDALGEDPSSEPKWKKPKWGRQGKGVFANGEDFATGGDKPEERSVQISFFAPGSEPALVDAEPVTTEQNPVQNGAVVVKKKIAPGGGGQVKPGANGIVVFYTDSPRTLDEAFKIQMALRPKPQKGTSSGKWVNAEESEVLDAMDPKKHFSDHHLYQFFDISSSNGLTEEDLAKYLANKGVLAGHAKDFLEGSKEAGVSEVYAAVHACLETGDGKSPLSKGVSVNGVTVHNMFGIGALDGNAEATGSKKAFDMGWTSPELAIRGGIKWIANNYIKNKQNTLYKMRWNPEKPGVHQYATAYNWALAQTAKMKRIGEDFPNSKKVFEISRYKDQVGWTIPEHPVSDAPNPAPVPVPTPGGQALDDPFKDIRTLVQAAKAESYTKQGIITALRKIWYNGFAWDHVIPGGADVKMPDAWSKPELAAIVARVRNQQVRSLGGSDVDLGHLFTGVDAKNRPSNIDLSVVKLRSNQEQSTFVGDLGSVAAEYIHTFSGSRQDLARKRNDALLKQKFDEYCMESDMAGNIDSYMIDFENNDVMNALDTYYAWGPGMSSQRRRRFVPIVKGTTRDQWKDEIFNSAKGYASGMIVKGEHPLWAFDVGLAIIAPISGFEVDLPIVGDVGPATWWEVYQNVSGWVADLFIQRYGHAESGPAPTPTPADDENGTGTRVPAPWMETALEEAARWKGADESVITKTINYHKKIGVALPDLNGTDHAWCASFVNYCLQEAGFDKSAQAARARSFKTDANFVKIDQPQYGAIACIGDHHVCFVVAKDQNSDYMVTLGGNTSNTIKYNVFKESTTFYLPKSYNKDTPSAMETTTAAALNATIGIGVSSGTATTR